MNDRIQMVLVSDGNMNCAFHVYQACEDFLSLGPEPKASFDMVLQDVAHSRETNGTYSLVINEEGDCIGVVDYIPVRQGADGVHCYISLIMIKSSYRNRGYGKKIVREVEGAVRRDYGVSQFRVSVQTNNEKGIRFWMDQGYVICSEPELQPDTTVVYQMKKEKGFDGSPAEAAQNEAAPHVDEKQIISRIMKGHRLYWDMLGNMRGNDNHKGDASWLSGDINFTYDIKLQGPDYRRQLDDIVNRIARHELPGVITISPDSLHLDVDPAVNPVVDLAVDQAVDPAVDPVVDLAAYLDGTGLFKRSATSLGMAKMIRADEAVSKDDKHLNIIRVRQPDELKMCGAILNAAFEYDLFAFSHYLDAFNTPEVAFLVAEYQGLPVGACMSLIADDVLEVAWVGTLNGYRKKGIAGSLIQATELDAMNEECFYILKGKGVVRTPNGETEVGPGDFLFFPADESGAHKITNPSETETLVYIDFDTENELDAAFYHDSGKVGIWGRNTSMVFRVADRAGYYDGE